MIQGTSPSVRSVSLLPAFVPFSFVTSVLVQRLFPKSNLTPRTEDVKMDQAAPSLNADPWLRYDPWSSREKPKQCKSEDLQLPSSHPFVGKDSKSVTQVHRQRLTPHAGGVAFTTKSQVQALLQLRPSEPAAILIPAVDPAFFDTLQPKPTTSAPHEVIVVDSPKGETYKRQVWMIELTTGISFHLPKPSYQAKLQEVREIVFEVDTRLISKDLNQGFSDRPHDYFKTKIADQFSSTLLPRVNLYAYRKFSSKGSETSHVVHQIMCKVPADKRAQVLEKSGVGCIFVRDYIAKGDKADDITPRFWEVTKQFKDESVKATGGLKGFAGLMISKRGIAARAWTSDSATLRRALLPLDDRLSELNLSIVPRVIRESTGWQSSISPQEIVRATHHALSAAPVPSRCFRSNGVTCWTLAFEKSHCNPLSLLSSMTSCMRSFLPLLVSESSQKPRMELANQRNRLPSKNLNLFKPKLSSSMTEFRCWKRNLPILNADRILLSKRSPMALIKYKIN